MKRCRHSQKHRILSGALKGRCSICLDAARNRYIANQCVVPLAQIIRNLGELPVGHRRRIISALNGWVGQ